MSEQKRYVVSEGGKSPPLMLIARNYLSAMTREALHWSLTQAIESGKPFVIEGGYEVYQLIDGRWIQLDGSVEIVDGPKVEPMKINFKEFL